MVDVKKLKLPAVSPECAKTLEMLAKEGATTQKIAKVIALDPVLSSNLIRYANSPLYRRSAPVTSVSAAVNLLGLKNVTAAVMMATMRSFAKNPSPVNDTLWQHSIAVSTLAKAIAAKACPAQAEEMELAALLHDMGALVLATNFAKQYDEIASAAMANGTALDVLEQQQFGIARGAIMERIAEEFRLPESIKALLIGYHQQNGPGTVGEQKSHAVLALAHWLEAEQTAAAERLPESIALTRQATQACLGLTDETVADVAAQCQQLLQERLAF